MNNVARLVDGAVVVEDHAEARLSDQEVRVGVGLAGVNFWEVMQRRGTVPIAEPRVLGTEGVGIVEEVGSGVKGIKAGDRVAWSKVRGSFAERVVGASNQFIVVPQEVDNDTAAGLLFQGTTAHYLAVDACPLGPGDTAVVTAAAGGVGLLLTQLLVARGVKVFGVVSAEAKASPVLAAGAELALVYGPELVPQIEAQVGEAGAAAVFDSVGGDVAEMLMGVLRVRGAMVLYGAAGGREAAISTRELGAGSYFLTRTAGVHYTRTDEEWASRARELMEMASSGRLRVHRGGEWRLGEVGAALDALESRRTVGKLFVSPRS